MGADSRIPLRNLAPASLVLFAVVLLIVIVSSLGGGEPDNGASTAPSRSEQSRDARTRGGGTVSANRRVYVVRFGDTLARIAERTGVPVDRLVSLNPSVDPQTLVTGQRIKLRE